MSLWKKRYSLKSIDCNVIFYKIHSSHSVYEISKNIIIGKAEHINSNNVVNPLPDKRRISNHSFWLPKKFLQKIINQNEKSSLIHRFFKIDL